MLQFYEEKVEVSMSPVVSLAVALVRYEDQRLASRNLAPLTRRTYLADLRRLVAYLAEREDVIELAQVTPGHLERYFAVLDVRGLAGATRRRQLAAVTSFFGFLQYQGLVPVSPAQDLVPPKREQEPPRVLTDKEYKRLQDAVQFDVRDAAIIELLLQTGLRLSELAGLTLPAVSLPQKISKDPAGAGSIALHGKGRKGRIVTLNWKASKALCAYLAVRPDVADPHVFITKFGKPIGPRSIENVVTKHLRAAGIMDASTHSLRHTFAIHSVKKGTNLDMVRQALGHVSLAVTSRYVALAREVMDRELQENAL